MQIITKQPDVTLFSHSNDPASCIALAVAAWGAEDLHKHPTDLPEATEKLYLKRALSAYHRTALEYVDTVWVIKNVSRAFQQQLTRTRLASYAIQSMRVVTKEGFATNGHYTMPVGLTEEEQGNFHGIMIGIQNQYESLIKTGMSAEDARGILPLNIHSDVTMRINLSALYHMAGQRMCLQTQWEYRQVVTQMKLEIESKMEHGKLFGKYIKIPCIGPNKCVVKEFCGIKVWEEDEESQLNLTRTFTNKIRDEK
jgi:flavin-dependent thymidylate synthase